LADGKAAKMNPWEDPRFEEIRRQRPTTSNEVARRFIIGALGLRSPGHKANANSRKTEPRVVNREQVDLMGEIFANLAIKSPEQRSKLSTDPPKL